MIDHQQSGVRLTVGTWIPNGLSNRFKFRTTFIWVWLWGW